VDTTVDGADHNPPVLSVRATRVRPLFLTL
jgi:hypothetical protein